MSALTSPASPVLARQPDVLRHDRRVFVLADKLPTQVFFADGLTVMAAETLDLTVWGQSLAEAEEAFAFAFDALYQNYYLEDDAQLAPDAQQLKQRLRQLILEVVEL